MATLGKMSEHIDLIQPMVTKDAAGFATTRDEVIGLFIIEGVGVVCGVRRVVAG